MPKGAHALMSGSARPPPPLLDYDVSELFFSETLRLNVQPPTARNDPHLLVPLTIYGNEGTQGAAVHFARPRRDAKKDTRRKQKAKPTGITQIIAPRLEAECVSALRGTPFGDALAEFDIGVKSQRAGETKGLKLLGDTGLRLLLERVIPALIGSATSLTSEAATIAVRFFSQLPPLPGPIICAWAALLQSPPLALVRDLELSRHDIFSYAQVTGEGPLAQLAPAPPAVQALSDPVLYSNIRQALTTNWEDSAAFHPQTGTVPNPLCTELASPLLEALVERPPESQRETTCNPLQVVMLTFLRALAARGPAVVTRDYCSSLSVLFASPSTFSVSHMSDPDTVSDAAVFSLSLGMAAQRLQRFYDNMRVQYSRECREQGMPALEEAVATMLELGGPDLQNRLGSGKLSPPACASKIIAAVEQFDQPSQARMDKEITALRTALNNVSREACEQSALARMTVSPPVDVYSELFAAGTHEKIFGLFRSHLAVAVNDDEDALLTLSMHCVAKLGALAAQVFSSARASASSEVLANNRFRLRRVADSVVSWAKAQRQLVLRRAEERRLLTRGGAVAAQEAREQATAAATEIEFSDEAYSELISAFQGSNSGPNRAGLLWCIRRFAPKGPRKERS